MTRHVEGGKMGLIAWLTAALLVGAVGVRLYREAAEEDGTRVPKWNE